MRRPSLQPLLQQLADFDRTSADLRALAQRGCYPAAFAFYALLDSV